LHRACLELEVELNARFGEFTTTLGALSNLKVGDEFKLSRKDSLEISVEGVPLFSGTSGRVGDLIAVRIDSLNES
jgi:flagellar motor switch protein FliM